MKSISRLTGIPSMVSAVSGLGTFDPNTQTADDLKKINGIGPKMEEVLNSLP